MSKDPMKLPDGMTCKDCQSFARTCSWLISYTGDEKRCDWSPSRFIPVRLALAPFVAGEAGGGK
jgi:hypothetical protein